jgi:CPA2 family monovalent cation:H+ antiporter-2
MLTLFAAGWLARRVGVSSVVGFLLAGLLLGPGGPVPTFEVGVVVSLLAELGLLLLLFYLGLEFSLARFAEGGRHTLTAGAVDLLHLPVVFGFGMLLGFGLWASLFLAAAVYISSSGVIAKLLAERDLIAYPEAERTLGVLVFEDLAMVVVLGGLGWVVAGGSPAALLGVAAFLIAYAVAVRFGRGVLETLLNRDGEALVLIALALVILVSLGGYALGFPEAVAAFLLGMWVSGTAAKARLEDALRPWYHAAAAVFFFDVGLQVEAVAALKALPLAALLLLVVTLTQTLTGVVAGRATGLSWRGSFGHAVMLLPRGEFTLVVLALAAVAPQVPAGEREALKALVSSFVILSVVLASVLYGRFDAVTDRLSRPWRRRGQADTRAAELDGMTLGEESM